MLDFILFVHLSDFGPANNYPSEITVIIASDELNLCSLPLALHVWSKVLMRARITDRIKVPALRQSESFRTKGNDFLQNRSRQEGDIGAKRCVHREKSKLFIEFWLRFERWGIARNPKAEEWNSRSRWYRALRSIS